MQSFGSGGSPSANVTAIGTSKVNLTSSWQKFTVTGISVPSISGKTAGTNNDDHLALYLWFDAGSNFDSRTGTLGQQSGTFDIAQVQLEENAVATPFEQRPIGVETALCQRYYCKSYNLTVDPGTVTTEGELDTIGYVASSGIRWVVCLPVSMRGDPTVTLYSPATGASGKYRQTSSSADHSAQLGTAGAGVVVLQEACVRRRPDCGQLLHRSLHRRRGVVGPRAVWKG